MASSMRSPPTWAVWLYMRPVSEIMPTSVVPPPVSTASDPTGSINGSPAPGARARNGGPEGTPFDRGRPGGNANDDVRAARHAGTLDVRLLDEVQDHLLRGFKVGNGAVANWSDCFQIVGIPPQPILCFAADRPDMPYAIDPFHGDYRRFVDGDADPLDVNHGVGGPEVDRDSRRVLEEMIEQAVG